MSTGTVVEMPEDLDLPFADQAQSEDPEVCDALADGDEPQEVSEVADAAEVTEADVAGTAILAVRNGSYTNILKTVMQQFKISLQGWSSLSSISPMSNGDWT